MKDTFLFSSWISSYCFLLTILIWSFSPCCLQELPAQSIKFRQYTTEHGLPHNVGFDIIQDDDGYLWIGMDNGLVRYDGRDFQVFTQEDGLNSPFIITLSKTPEGKIRIGPHRKEWLEFSDDSIRPLPISWPYPQPPAMFHLSDSDVLSYGLDSYRFPHSFFRTRIKDTTSISEYYLLKEREGQPYIDTIPYDADKYGSNDPFRYNSVEKLILYPELYSKKYVEEDIHLAMHQTQKGNILFLTKEGLYEFHPTQGLRIRFPGHQSPKGGTAMDEDNRQFLWIASKEFLYEIDPQGNTMPYPISEITEEILQIRVIKSDFVYLLTRGNQETAIRQARKLYLFRPKAGSIQDITAQLNLNKAEISFIEKDKEDNLWLTTEGAGVICLYNHYFENFGIEEGLRQHMINDILSERNGNIWVAHKNGLDLMKSGRKRFEKIRPIHPTTKFGNIHDLTWTSTGQSLLLSQPGETYEIDVKTLEATLCFPWSPKKLHFDRHERIMSRKSDKLAFFQCGGDAPELYTHAADSLFIHNSEKIYLHDQNGNYWVSANGGLLCYTGSETAEYYTMERGLPSSQVNDILETANGKIYLATEKGLAILNGDRFHDMFTQNQLPPIQARTFLQDQQGRFWIGTPKGLYLYQEGTLMAFNSQSGIMADDVQCLHIDAQQQLWIGTSGGISKLDLTQEFVPQSPPALYWKDIWIDDKAVKISELSTHSINSSIRLAYETVSLSSNAKDIVFQYKLKESDPWQNTQNRTLVLNNLQPDFYQLKIRTRGLNSGWGRPLQANFTLVAPIWQRPWFLVASLVLIFFGVLLRVLTYQRKVRIQKAQKDRANRELSMLRLKALQAQINPHFIFNAINVIQGYILQNDIDRSSLYLARFSKLMRMFLESSKRELLPLSEEVDQLKLFIEIEQLCYEGRFTYAIQIDDELMAEEIMIPAMLFQPFVENAIHHGLLNKEEIGHLTIRFWGEVAYVRAEIKDNGIGRAKAKELQKKMVKSYVSRGMEIVTERLALQNKLDAAQIRIEVIDRKDDQGDALGTSVEFYLPLVENMTRTE